ncbi:hypothetical protein SBADM41S_07304 [Streptomyces badius]
MPEKVNVANNGVNHVLDIVLAQSLVQLALALVGFSRPAVLVAGLFVAAQGYFVHANIDVRIGPLNHLLASPSSTACTTAPICPTPATTAPTSRAGTACSAVSPGAPAANPPPSASTTRFLPPPARSSPPSCTPGDAEPHHRAPARSECRPPGASSRPTAPPT